MTVVSFFEKSWAALESRLSSFVPALVATALLLILGWVISRLLAAVTERFLKRIKLDSWIDRSEIADRLQPGQQPPAASRVISRLVFWLFFLSFVVLAMEQLGLELSVLPVEAFIAYLPAVLGAVFLLLAGIVLAAFLGRATESALRGMGLEHPQRIGRLVKGLVIALTAVVVIEQLGFDVTTLTQTFSNVLVVVVAGLMFAFAWGGREVARNVLAGYYLREHFQQGDRVRVDGVEGELVEFGSLNARLELADGEAVVPNARLIEQTVSKRSSEA